MFYSSVCYLMLWDETTTTMGNKRVLFIIEILLLDDRDNQSAQYMAPGRSAVAAMPRGRSPGKEALAMAAPLFYLLSVSAVMG